MKRKDVIHGFLSSETEEVGGYAVSHGWDVSDLETLLPAKVFFPKIFKELYNSASFESFDSSPITFLGNDDGNASEVFEYFESNQNFVRECCELGYLPFARCETGAYDPVCFDLKSNPLSRGDYAVVMLSHEPLLQLKKAVVQERISGSLYEFMRGKIES